VQSFALRPEASTSFGIRGQGQHTKTAHVGVSVW
jgi:hypothetical protein